MQSRFTLYVIVIEDRGELGRMVFRYTQADAEVIREMFAGKDNLDFVKVDDGESSLVVVVVAVVVVNAIAHILLFHQCPGLERLLLADLG